MFSRDTYREYFLELENKYRELLVIYTDLFNELDNKAVRSKISVLTSENLEAYRFTVSQREKFSSLEKEGLDGREEKGSYSRR